MMWRMEPDHARYHEVVRKTLELIRDRKEPITSVADVASAANCSPAHLWRIFKTVTGRGVRTHLLDARIGKVKRLLTDTALNITEVAFEAGFDSPSNFARLFRRVTGVSPRQFRRARQNPESMPAARPLAGSADLVIKDDFAGDDLAARWDTHGQWRIGNGMAEGTGTPWLRLELAPRLPENLRIEFDFQATPGSSWNAVPLRFSLNAPEASSTYACVTLPGSARTPGILTIRGRTVALGPAASFQPRGWNAVRAEFRDNRLLILLNGARLFSFQDLFPPPVASHCRFNVFAERGGYRFRRFRLYDLGLPDVVPSIRQGDALFSSGLFEQAREFYLRHLRPDMSREEETELRFKVGVCLHRQQQVEACRDWVHHIQPIAPTAYWRRQCDLLLLELDEEHASAEVFERRARVSLRDPEICDGLHPIVATAFARRENAGFLDDAMRVGNLWLSMERKAGFTSLAVREPVVKLLKKSKQFRAATRLLRPLCQSTEPGDAKFRALISLFDTALLQGRYERANAITQELRALCGKEPEAAVAVHLEASRLRAQRQFPAAVQRFASIRASFPTMKDYSEMADAALAELLYCLRREREAGRIMAGLLQASPKRASHPGIPLRGPTLADRFASGRCDGLADLLLKNARLDSPDVFSRGQNAVVAGIALELAGKPGEAKAAWMETTRRFPAQACYFWGAFAGALATGRPDHVETLRHYYHVRSELFFLTGLLEEHRGHSARARRLFRHAVKEDPTFLWPAHLAQRKLDARRPTSERSVQGEDMPAGAALAGRKVAV